MFLRFCTEKRLFFWSKTAHKYSLFAEWTCVFFNFRPSGDLFCVGSRTIIHSFLISDPKKRRSSEGRNHRRNNSYMFSSFWRPSFFRVRGQNRINSLMVIDPKKRRSPEGPNQPIILPAADMVQSNHAWVP
jgi:hypothetical protein